MSLTGLDAMERVLKKAKKIGMKEFGQGYKTTTEIPDSPVQVA
jgi:hypothetical protein